MVSIFYSLFIGRSNYVENNLKRSMDNVCTHCHALYFSSETVHRGVFHKCCMDGKYLFRYTRIICENCGISPFLSDDLFSIVW